MTSVLLAAIAATQAQAPTVSGAEFHRNHCLFSKNGSFEAEEGFDACRTDRHAPIRRRQKAGELMMHAAKQLGGRPLVLHFHGGLVEQTSAIESAKSLYRTVYAAHAYPVFMLWRGGFTDTYAAAGKERPLLKLAAGDLGMLRASQSAARFVLAELKRDAPWRPGQPETELDRRMIAGGVRDFAVPMVKPWVFAQLATTRRRTVEGDDIDGLPLGAGAVAHASWLTMKEIVQRTFAEPTGAGADTIRAMRTYLQANQRIVLIGHSTGALAILRFLQTAHREWPGKRFDVVWLSGAVTYADLGRALPALDATVARFVSLGLSDELERRNGVLGDAPFLPMFLNRRSLDSARRKYGGSLLYYVSDLLEDDRDVALIGLQRFARHIEGRPLHPIEADALDWLVRRNALHWIHDDPKVQDLPRTHTAMNGEGMVGRWLANFLKEPATASDASFPAISRQRAP